MSDTVEQWQKRVASWRASGETAEAFSAGRGWSAHTLRQWASRLKQFEASPPAIRLAQLVRATSAGDREPRSGAIIVELHAAQVRITIEPGADPDMAAAVLAQLAPSEAP